jgi:hypothetical protein
MSYCDVNVNGVVSHELKRLSVWVRSRDMRMHDTSVGHPYRPWRR